MGKRRNETSDDTSVPCSSEKEEIASESVFDSVPFSDGLCNGRLARPSRTIKPTNRMIAFLNPLFNLCDNVLTSASIASGHRSTTAVGSVSDRSKQIVEI